TRDRHSRRHALGSARPPEAIAGHKLWRGVLREKVLARAFLDTENEGTARTRHRRRGTGSDAAPHDQSRQGERRQPLAQHIDVELAFERGKRTGLSAIEPAAAL